MRAKDWYTCTRCDNPIGPGDEIRRHLHGYAHRNCQRVIDAIKRREQEVVESARESEHAETT